MDVVSFDRPASRERACRIIGGVAIAAGAMLPWASATSLATTTSAQALRPVIIASIVVVVSLLARAPRGIRGVAVQLGGLVAVLLAYDLPGELVGVGGVDQAELALGTYVTLLGYLALAAGLYEELIASRRRAR